MSIVLLVTLAAIGFLLATVGSIVGVVESFRESAVWGLLYLFVPFASLVFTIKFWQQREWVRKGLFASLVGVALLMLSGIVAAFVIPPTEFAQYEELGTQEPSLGETYSTATADGGASATYVAQNDPFRDAVNLATDAANLTQAASTKEDWAEVAYIWSDSIALLGAVPPSDANYTTAQTKIKTYGQNLSYAQQNAKQG